MRDFLDSKCVIGSDGKLENGVSLIKMLICLCRPIIGLRP